MSAFETVLEKLDSAKKLPNGSYLALCPSHPDKNPSLSVTNSNGKVLLKCFAGCDTEQILSALGLSLTDLFDDKPQDSKPKVVAEYPYCDINGKLMFVVERLEPKSFRQKKPDGKGWSWSTSDLADNIRGLPYKLSELAKALRDDPSRRVLIVEGEKDVHTLWQIGELATTLAGGCASSNSKARVEAFLGHLEAVGAKSLVIIADRDKPGREHAQRLLKAAQAHGFKVEAQEFGCSDNCKDSSNAILKHGGSWEWEAELVDLEPEQKPVSMRTIDTIDNIDTLPLTRENVPEKCQWGVNEMPKVSMLLPKLGIMGEFASHLAGAMQVDQEFALTAALATVSLPVGLSVNVQVRSDWVEPAITQILLVAPPSERKTPVLHACMTPLYEAERLAREERKSEIAKAKALGAQLELEKTEARKNGNYQSACERLENHEIPNEFRAILGKATAEALEVQAARQGERLARIAVVSDEGGAVFGDFGRYQNSTNWEILLAGYDARRYSSDRLARDSVLVDELRIPLFLMLQPSAWDSVKGDPAASGRGVLSRLSPVRPRSLVGERFGFGSEIPKVVSAKWSHLLTQLFTEAYESDEAVSVTVSSEALKKWASYKDIAEVELGDGTFEGDLLTGWGGKKAGRALRLAAIVHAALTGTLRGQISETEMALGIELAEWLGLHALREFGGAGMIALLSRDARRLAETAQELEEFTRREALRKLYQWTVARFTKAVKELEELGLVESEDTRGLRWKWLGNSESVNGFAKVSMKVSMEKADITAGHGQSVNVVNGVNGFVNAHKSVGESDSTDTQSEPTSEVIHNQKEKERVMNKPKNDPSESLASGQFCKRCGQELYAPQSVARGTCKRCEFDELDELEIAQ